MVRCITSPVLRYFVNQIRQMLTIKLFFLTCFFSFFISLLFIKSQGNKYDTNLVQEALENASKDSRFAEIYRKTNRLPDDLKYILFWKGSDYAPLYYFSNGQRSFIEQDCASINCYVTSDRNFFNGDLKRFDAIAFNGRSMYYSSKKYDLPQHKWAHQKFIYFDMESSDNYPVCKNVSDGFFNWTSTYRLDSDIPYPYILIKNNLDEVVGPKVDMTWVENMDNVSEELSNKLLKKTKPLAWFVSHCKTRSGRELKMKEIQKALAAYNLTVDIYGSCGPLNCSRNKQIDCDKKLESDYYFYYSAENSFAEDYVTEKLLSALQHDVVPIVFGGANYSRFLPPGSYLNSRQFKPSELAAQIVHLMQTPGEYRQFFRWKKHYSYHFPAFKENVCSVCAALNNNTLKTSTTYENFRQWWNPNFKKRCKL